MKDVQLLVFLILGVAVIVSGFPRERDVESMEDGTGDVPLRGVPAVAVPTGPEYGYIPSYFGYLPDFDLVSRIKGLVTRLRSQIGDSFGNIDWSKGNATSTTKVIDGHVVTVNETSYKDDDSDLVLHVKIIDVKPTEDAEESSEVTSPKENDVAPSATSSEDLEDNNIPNKPEEEVAESLEYKNKPEETREHQIEIREYASPDYLDDDDKPVEEVDNVIEENKPATSHTIPLHNDIRVNKIMEDKEEMVVLPEDVEFFVPDNRDMYTVNKDNEYVYNPKNMPIYEIVPYTEVPDIRVNKDNGYIYSSNNMPIYENVPYTEVADNRDLYTVNKDSDSEFVYSPNNMPIYVHRPKNMPIYETVPYTLVPDNRDLYTFNKNNEYAYSPKNMPIYRNLPHLRFQHRPQRLTSLT